MRKATKTLAIATAIAAGVAAAPALYAHESQDPGSGMMGQGMMGQGSMMEQGSMMQQMSRMMENCNAMMQSMKDHHGETAPAGPAPKEAPEQNG